MSSSCFTAESGSRVASSANSKNRAAWAMTCTNTRVMARHSRTWWRPSSRSVLVESWRWDVLGWPLEQRAGGIVGEYDGADVGEALAQVVVLEVLVGRPHIHPQPVGTFVRGLGPGPIEQLGAQALAAVGAIDGDLVGI